MSRIFDLLCGTCCPEVLRVTQSKSWYEKEIELVTASIKRLGDEWHANFERVKALEGVLPQPALAIVARELGVKDWELSE